MISDALNHASIIDGIRLCKAQRFRYANNDMNELEARLKEAQHCRVRLIATDGVFSMDGVIARLSDICDLADRYDALVMVDDSHATGFVGARGRGTHEFVACMDRVDILTGTLGKALGGASGGYTSGRKEIIAWLRQRSRPYLFSNSIPPFIAAATLRVLDLLEADTSCAIGCATTPRISARHDRGRIQPRARRASDHSGHARRREARHAISHSGCSSDGVYVIGFSFPVVPQGKARIRTQMSAAHTRDQLRSRRRQGLRRQIGQQNARTLVLAIAIRALMHALVKAHAAAGHRTAGYRQTRRRPERRADPRQA